MRTQTPLDYFIINIIICFVFQGCIKRQFSTRQEGRHAPARLISLKPKYSFIRKLASTTSESNPPLPDKNEEKVEISSDNTSAKAGDTIVKGRYILPFI